MHQLLAFVGQVGQQLYGAALDVGIAGTRPAVAAGAVRGRQRREPRNPAAGLIFAAVSRAVAALADNQPKSLSSMLLPGTSPPPLDRGKR